MLKTVVLSLTNIFVEIDKFYVVHKFQNSTIFNIINAFTVSFDQFNASLLNESIFHHKVINGHTLVWRQIIIIN